MRKFEEMLFHGNGEESVKKIKSLIKIVKSGHLYFSGMQQGIDIHTEEYLKGEEEIKDVCRDVLASFGFSDEGLKWKKIN